MTDNGADAGFYEDDKDRQEMDYWYNRVMDAKSPASHTANPSALALITFGLTIALLQVRLSSAYLTARLQPVYSIRDQPQ